MSDIKPEQDRRLVRPLAQILRQYPAADMIETLGLMLQTHDAPSDQGMGLAIELVALVQRSGNLHDLLQVMSDWSKCIEDEEADHDAAARQN